MSDYSDFDESGSEYNQVSESSEPESSSTSESESERGRRKRKYKGKPRAYKAKSRGANPKKSKILPPMHSPTVDGDRDVESGRSSKKRHNNTIDVGALDRVKRNSTSAPSINDSIPDQQNNFLLMTVPSSHSTPTSQSSQRTPATVRISADGSFTDSVFSNSQMTTPSSSRQSTPTQSGARKELSIEEEIRRMKKKQQVMEAKLDKITQQNEVILRQLNVLTTFNEKHTQKKGPMPVVRVPSEIKAAVHDGQKSGQKEGLMWKTQDESGRKLKWMSEENSELNEYTRNYVKGLYPSTETGVINAGIQTYFTSFKQKENKRKLNTEDKHRKAMSQYGRKSRKLRWRQSAVKAKTSWDDLKKEKVKRALHVEYMSSEEEQQSDDDSVFIIRPLPWRSTEFNTILIDLDEKAKNLKSSQSRRQELKRVRAGSPSKRPKPDKIDTDNLWAFA